MSPPPTPISRQFLGRASALLEWMDEEGVTDILVNGTHSLFVERQGRLVAEASPFTDPASLFDLIERMLIPIGKRIDAAHPYVDGRLVDGSRFHIILPPVAVEGPLISIRKLRRPAQGITLESFAPREVAEWLGKESRARRNILIGGGTGTGKTTLLCVLLDGAESGERVAVIEETKEIDTLHPHVVHLEGRPPSPDGTGEVTLRSLIRNALRMRPDRIVLGECRGAEAFDTIQAMNTGHSGSLCTIHANSALDSLKRMEGLVLLAAMGVTQATVREWIASAVHMVVHMERKNGQRRISEILSLQGLEGERYRILPRYKAVTP